MRLSSQPAGVLLLRLLNRVAQLRAIRRLEQMLDSHVLLCVCAAYLAQ